MRFDHPIALRPRRVRTGRAPTWPRACALFEPALFVAAALTSASATAQTAPLLAVSVRGAPDPVVPGGLIVYTVRLSNPNPTTPSGAITVRANVPQSSSVASVAITSNGTCGLFTCRRGNVITWAVASLPPGTSTVLRYNALVDNTAANPAPTDGTLLSSDVSAATTTTTVTDATTVMVSAGGAGLDVAISGAPQRVAAGATVTYDLSFGNVSAVPLAAQLHVALPPGMTFVSATGGGSPAAGGVVWDVGTIASGFSDRRQLVAVVAAATSGGTLLVADADMRDPTGQTSLVRASTTSVVAPTNLLAVNVSASPDPAQPGQTIVYRVSLSNLSANTATPTFPLWTTVPEFASVASGTITGGGTCGLFSCRRGNIISWNAPALLPGASVVFSFAAVIDNSLAAPPPPNGTILRTTVTAFVFGGVSADREILIGTGRNLDLGIDAAPSRVAPGATLTLSVSYGNPGVTTVPAVLLVPLPLGTTLVAATGNGTPSGGAMQWDLGSVPAGFTDRRQLTVQVGAGVSEGTTLVGEAELRDPGTQQTLVRASVPALVATTNLLAMSVDAQPDPVGPGRTILYDIHLANLSTNTPTGAFTLWATVPEFTSVASGTITGSGTCGLFSCRRPEIIVWTVASLAPGAGVVLQFAAVVDNAVATPPPPNGAILSTDVTAFLFGGVNVSRQVLVATGRNLDLAIGATPNRVLPGANLDYVIDVGNTGVVGVPALLRVPVPAGTTFVSAGGGGVLSGGAVQWAFGTVGAGFTGRLPLTVQVAPDATDGELLVGEAELRDPSTQQTLVRASSANLVAASSLLSLSLSGTPDPVAPGQSIVYRLILTNLSSNTPTGDFALRANLPDFVSVASGAITGGGTCGLFTCRRPNIIGWSVPSIAPLATTALQFTAVVDNSATTPPPANGTILSSDATAFIFGGVQDHIHIHVGNAGTIGGGGIAGIGGMNGTGGIAGIGGINGTGGIAGIGGAPGTGGVSGTGGVVADAGPSGSGGAGIAGNSGAAGAPGGDGGANRPDGAAADGLLVADASDAADGASGGAAGGKGGSNGGGDAGTSNDAGGGTGGKGRGGSGCSCSTGTRGDPGLGAPIMALLAMALVLRRRAARSIAAATEPRPGAPVV
ncbi:MAG TPA: hypothetical protein VFH68_19065 [Polyangia bacterium]|nr:hypothetical protein [Polyangia bacterium]